MYVFVTMLRKLMSDHHPGHRGVVRSCGPHVSGSSWPIAKPTAWRCPMTSRSGSAGARRAKRSACRSSRHRDTRLTACRNHREARVGNRIRRSDSYDRQTFQLKCTTVFVSTIRVRTERGLTKPQYGQVRRSAIPGGGRACARGRHQRQRGGCRGVAKRARLTSLPRSAVSTHCSTRLAT